jgi:signal recognition particle receptor subunit beta
MKSGKVVVVGPAEAGKSTLIRLLAEKAMNLEHRGRTVAMDHAVLRREGGVLCLVGVPGQHVFGAVREALATRSLGLVWVHPQGEPVDAVTVDLVRAGAPAPYLVVVNRRQAGGDGGDFEPPRSLPAPHGVIFCDLVKQPETRFSIEDAIWRMVSN